MRGRIEVDEIPGADIHRADAEPRLPTVIDAIEVDQPLKRRLQGRHIIVADHIAVLRRPP